MGVGLRFRGNSLLGALLLGVSPKFRIRLLTLKEIVRGLGTSLLTLRPVLRLKEELDLRSPPFFDTSVWLMLLRLCSEGSVGEPGERVGGLIFSLLALRFCNTNNSLLLLERRLATLFSILNSVMSRLGTSLEGTGDSLSLCIK